MEQSRLATVDDILARVVEGDTQAFDRLLPLVYDEMRRLARQRRRRFTGADSLNTTALVHEAYLKLAGQSRPSWRDLPHFLAVASRAMRHILIDHAKRSRRAKRGGGVQPIAFEEIEDALSGGVDPSDAGAEALVALDEALRRLERHDSRQSRIVECRFFGGMTIDETAHALGLSPATVKRGWTMAQAWLYRELASAEVTA